MPETTVVIGSGVRAELRPRIADLGAARQVFALVDEPVQAAFPDLVPGDWRLMTLPGGEACKSFPTLERVLRQMAQWELDRDCVVVAIGGGAIGDLGGLAASLFLRGVALIQVPTTLLAMLDSSVGGKTAIDIPEGKNLVGTFHSARLMLADVDFVRTLPRDQLRSGLAEAVKMGIGFDAELFELLEAHTGAILDADPDLLTRIVRACVDAKLAVVTADPLESTGRRRCLNLGHTLAHALEALSDYSVLHGLAVAQGLHFALDVAVRRGALAGDAGSRGHALLERYGYAREPLPDAERLRTYFRRDKKMVAGRLHFVLPTAIGACETCSVDPAELC